MTTSATDTFQQTTAQIIADALTKLGVLGPGRTPTGNQYSHGLRALNRIVKEIDADGDFLWRTIRRTITIVAGTASYGPTIVGADVLGLEDPCTFTLTGQPTRTQVTMMSNEDYRQLADVTTTGTPSQYLVEWTLSGITLTLWPVPDQGGTLEMMAALRAKDFLIGTNTPDFTSKWDRCLVWGLAGELAPDYGQSPTNFLQQFEAIRSKLLNNDNENGDMTLVPFGAYGGYSGV